MNNEHSYLKEKSGRCGLINETSEKYHMDEINHFITKRSAEVFRKSPEEKAILATRIRNYPNRNHEPIPPNN